MVDVEPVARVMWLLDPSSGRGALMGLPSWPADDPAVSSTDRLAQVYPFTSRHCCCHNTSSSTYGSVGPIVPWPSTCRQSLDSREQQLLDLLAHCITPALTHLCMFHSRVQCVRRLQARHSAHGRSLAFPGVLLLTRKLATRIAYIYIQG